MGDNGKGSGKAIQLPSAAVFTDSRLGRRSHLLGVIVPRHGCSFAQLCTLSSGCWADLRSCLRRPGSMTKGLVAKIDKPLRPLYVPRHLRFTRVGVRKWTRAPVCLGPTG